ncbi:MAG: hypothetical protein A2075_22070 [Geobacteraceae bacterium GWC2_58_44]|nr:MAG: hypothetical protein A2075_22070 [Geobacteraceae bacterium GWC2_58_44]HBG07050.1 hypothetical protein [Geobacter sp.]
MTRNAKKTSTGIALTLLAVALTGCTGPGKTTKSTAPAPAASGLSGKVVETMDGGGYTYMLLERDGGKIWVAAPVMKVTVGQELKLLPGAEMNNFSSKALNRDFEKIIFSGGLDQKAAPSAPTVSDSSNESAQPLLTGKVVETMDAMQYTYIKLEKDGKSSWSAVPATAVAVGDEIELLPGTAMGKFTSKRLNRTFNSIYFASGVKSNATAPAAPAALPEGHPKAEAAAGLPAGHPKVEPAVEPAPKAPIPVPAANLITGKVVETADAGGYTYICLEKDGEKTWAAVPPMKVSVGQELAITPGVVMSNFVSKSLNRTFDKILFSNGPQPQ